MAIAILVMGVAFITLAIKRVNQGRCVPLNGEAPRVERPALVLDIDEISLPNF